MLGHRWIGPILFMAQWSLDGHWDWTADNGDKHVDVAALVLLRRPGRSERVVRLSLGPPA
jgi:hypothetical protein